MSDDASLKDQAAREAHAQGIDIFRVFDSLNDLSNMKAAMEAVQRVHVSEVFLKHSVELVRRTRESKLLDFGCSPRAGLALVNAARARAVIEGRGYAIPDDVKWCAFEVLIHRVILKRQFLERY